MFIKLSRYLKGLDCVKKNICDELKGSLIYNKLKSKKIQSFLVLVIYTHTTHTQYSKLKNLRLLSKNFLSRFLYELQENLVTVFTCGKEKREKCSWLKLFFNNSYIKKFEKNFVMPDIQR